MDIQHIKNEYLYIPSARHHGNSLRQNHICRQLR